MTLIVSTRQQIMIAFDKNLEEDALLEEKKEGRGEHEIEGIKEA